MRRRTFLTALGGATSHVIRYNKFIGSTSAEHRNPDQIISIGRIREEQEIARFGLVKMDIEGGERDLFSEPDWLSHVDTLVMELHPHLVGNLAIIPRALEGHGFHYVTTNQMGKFCEFKDVMFLYASCADALADS